MRKDLYVSPYKLQGFEECPEWFYFEYLDEEIHPYRRELKKPRSFFTVGDCVHKTISAFFIRSAGQRNEQLLFNLLKQIWDQYSGARGGFENAEEEKNCFIEAKEMLKNFWKRQQKMGEPFYSPGIVPGKELKKSEIGPDLILMGKLDRIDPEGEDLHVIDYKTGKKEEGSSFQIMAYGVLAEAVFQKDVSKVSFWYLRSGRMQTFLYNLEERDKILEKINTIVSKIKAEKKFAPRVGSRCYICDYVQFCPKKEEVLKLLKKEMPSQREISKLPF